jgi:hypothetical protein
MVPKIGYTFGCARVFMLSIVRKHSNDIINRKAILRRLAFECAQKYTLKLAKYKYLWYNENTQTCSNIKSSTNSILVECYNYTQYTGQTEISIIKNSIENKYIACLDDATNPIKLYVKQT